jgi:tRNA dimethylallyltransferase
VRERTGSVLSLIVLVGPTAVGKTETSISLAQRLDGEIVSADSRLLYRGMDIGTAKPSLLERQLVPHHLVDIADPNETWSLAIYQSEAQHAIEDISRRGRLPFLVGGTGQYIRAVTHGWQPPEVQPDTRLRDTLSQWASEIGGSGLYERLAILDPLAAERIDPRNVRRTVRALEVIFLTGKKFSEQSRSQDPLYRTLVLGLSRSREELYGRIDARIDQILAGGLVHEVEGLLAKGYAPELPALSAIGYREIITFLQGKMTLEEAITQIRRSTRLFVRRQANWFKPDDPSIRWFSAGDKTVDEMTRCIQEFVESSYRIG